MERALMRLQTLRVDTHRMLSEHFKIKVQLREQMDDNEVKLHFCRGCLAALDEMEQVINESLSPVPKIPSEDFEGQAMEKTDGIKFPGYQKTDDVPPEYGEAAFGQGSVALDR